MFFPSIPIINPITLSGIKNDKYKYFELSYIFFKQSKRNSDIILIAKVFP